MMDIRCDAVLLIHVHKLNHFTPSWPLSEWGEVFLH